MRNLFNILWKSVRVLLPFYLFIFSPLSMSAQGLRDAMGKYCLIGSSLNVRQTCGTDVKINTIVDRHFNTAVAENCMKPESVQRKEGRFNFQDADRFVRYCEQHHLTPIGHVLVWHEQTPKWFFYNEDGSLVQPEVLKARMKAHIYTVVGRYKGRLKGWDVVNEAVADDGTMRQSPWYQVLGEEFFELAFRYAHEADPDAELYYNDYSLSSPKKRETVCRLVRQLKAKGLRIDGVGMQSHNGMDYPNLQDYEQSMVAYAACGVKVMITELDLNVLPNPENYAGADPSKSFAYDEKMNPYKNGLPADKARAINKRWFAFFRLYYKHRDKISRINLWGITDADSWLNNWPIVGRTGYPLLFNRNYEAKPVVNDIIKLYQ